jgi:hypothetical protein
MTDKFLGMSETFWTGIEALAACSGFILLLLYTLYTRKMMKIGEFTRRAQITPVFSATEVSPFVYGFIDDLKTCGMSTTVRNVGEGPALLIWAWHQPVSENFKLKGTTLLIPTGSVGSASCPKSELLKGESICIHFDPFGKDVHAMENNSWLFVVEAFDQANGRHQLQIIRILGTDDSVNVQFKMVNSLGETIGERAVKSARRFVDIIQAVRVELKKLSRRH